jgi:YD repeat-containing protein
VLELCLCEPSKIWDPNHPRASNPNPTQLYTYDKLNCLTSVTQPWTGAGGGTAVTRYGYDVQDHLTSVTDAEGNVTTYTFSDRDLMTQQSSPVSGTSTSTYNEHGEQATETDARKVVTMRTTDVLDRVTAVSYPDSRLNTSYTYDTGAFGKGRLTGITRHGETLAYAHDRFGRLLQDGTLTYGYDANSNRTTITHPESVTATYTHDFADRESTLQVQVGASPPLQLVNAATYEPFGPLKTLALGNGLTETRTFDQRYSPADIRVDGMSPLLDWSYATDFVGNITSISDLLNPANNRTYGYQDIHYFLTQGNGPWGPRSWTYDKIGNRLTETRGAITDTYTYLTNGSGGRNPKLQSVAPPTGESRKYGYDAAGNNTFIYDRDNRFGIKGTRAQYVATWGQSKCLVAAPCVAFLASGKFYLFRQGELVEFSNQSRSFIRAEVDATRSRFDEIVRSLDPSKEWFVSVTADRWVIARKVEPRAQK